MDAGRPDAGARDAAPSDARPPVDAGPPDAAPADAAPPDATPPDAELPDAAEPRDAAVELDAGGPDAVIPADAAAPDAAPDAEPPPPEPLRCTPVLPLGARCDGDDRACEAGLTCVAGFCLARSGEGGDCDGSGDCDGQLYCRQYSLDGEALAVGVCTARTPADEPCHRRNFGCEFGLICLDDVCQPRSAEGDPCLTTGDCDAMTWCDLAEGDRGTCQPFIPEAAPCEPRNSGCTPGLVCLDATCQMRQPMGEGCQSAADCLPDQYCDRRDDDGNPRQAGVCLGRSLLGQACDARELSVCRQSRCLGGVCAADQPAGGVCESAFDCADGLWCPQP